MKEIVYTKNAPEPVGPYSQAVKAGNTLYISGQIPIDPKTNELVMTSFEIQCRLVLDNLKAVVEAGGSSLQNVVKVGVFLKNLGNFAEFNAIYSEYFGDSKPARFCVEVSKLPKNVDVELDAIAVCE